MIFFLLVSKIQISLQKNNSFSVFNIFFCPTQSFTVVFVSDVYISCDISRATFFWEIHFHLIISSGTRTFVRLSLFLCQSVDMSVNKSIFLRSLRLRKYVEFFLFASEKKEQSKKFSSCFQSHQKTANIAQCQFPLCRFPMIFAACRLHLSDF